MYTKMGKIKTPTETAGYGNRTVDDNARIKERGASSHEKHSTRPCISRAMTVLSALSKSRECPNRTSSATATQPRAVNSKAALSCHGIVTAASLTAVVTMDKTVTA